MAKPQDELDALRAQVAALTARVYQLERMSGLASEPRQQTSPSREPMAQPPAVTVPAPPSAQGYPGGGAPRGTPLPPSPHTHPPTSGLPASVTAGADLEKKIGQYWLNRIGIVAILIGVSYFLKYAFENNWIGPAGRIAIGLLTGIGLILWSERFRNRGYIAFSYSLKAVGIGTLYLSLWGAFQIYHLIPSAAAFVAMIIVTAATIALAFSQDAQLLASFALLGGFATPVLLSTGQNHEVVLFTYVCLLDLACLAMVILKPWRRLLWGSFAGTIVLYAGWYGDYYSDDHRMVTVLFATLFAAIFAAIPLVTRNERSTRFAGPSVTLTFLPLLNAGAFFLALYVIYESETVSLTWYALALACVYLGISSAIQRRFPDQDTTVVRLLHVAIAIAFLTIAIPLKLNARWITIGWLVESAVLLWVSVRTQVNFLRYFAVAALSLGIFRLLFFDQIQAQMLMFNPRFASYVVAVAVLGGIAVFGKRHASEMEMPFVNVAAVGVNLLALIALTLEASDYFDRQMVNSGRSVQLYHQLTLARDYSYSAIWLAYGATLMVIGFRRSSAFVRWQALLLIAFTIGKVFVYDVSQLGGSYRILSFLALGAVLLGISFIYQRDWLKLSSRSGDKAGQEKGS